MVRHETKLMLLDLLMCKCCFLDFWELQSLAATFFSRFLFCVGETGWLRVFSYFFLF